jgi:superfamily II DNA or RNA helicase
VGLPELYPFQKEACVSLWEVARRARERKAAGGAGERCLCVQPTGAGKTVEILAFARATTLRWGWRALVIEPTKGLVSKAKAKKGEHGRRRFCDFDAGLVA